MEEEPPLNVNRNKTIPLIEKNPFEKKKVIGSSKTDLNMFRFKGGRFPKNNDRMEEDLQ